MKRLNAKGFTLTELAVVIAVVAILATIVVVMWRGAVESAQDTAVKSDLIALSNEVDLKALDNQSIPDGGRTSAGVGTASLFPGVTIRTSQGSYASDVNNLFYCAGEISGIRQYTIVAKSKSGKYFAYKSEGGGISELASQSFTSTSTGTNICPQSSYAAPYTWSYGYQASPPTWFTWANSY